MKAGWDCLSWGCRILKEPVWVQAFIAITQKVIEPIESQDQLIKPVESEVSCLIGMKTCNYTGPFCRRDWTPWFNQMIRAFAVILRHKV